MKSTVQLLSFLVFGVAYSATAAAIGKLPSGFDICKRNMPQFDQCMERAVEKAIGVLVKGDPSLGIFSVDPLEITAIDIDQGTGPVSINLKFRDLLIKGLKATKVRDLHVDLDNLIFTARATFPKILLDGLYNIDGKVLILPIKGDGKSKLVLDDVTADIVLTGKQFKKDGQTYMKVTKFDFNIDTKKLSINLANLFNGDKALGDNMNRFLNENSIEILKELKPAIQQTFGAAFTEISNRIFTKVPFDDIFPKK